MSKCQLKSANKKYSTNDYELTLSKESVIRECDEHDSENVPKLEHNLIPISQIAEKVHDEFIGAY